MLALPRDGGISRWAWVRVSALPLIAFAQVAVVTRFDRLNSLAYPIVCTGQVKSRPKPPSRPLDEMDGGAEG